VVEPGFIEVVYEVDHIDVSEVELSVSVCGVKLAGGTWLPVSGCRADGVHVAILPLKDAEGNRGLAITSDGSLMVVSNSMSHQLSVYRASDGNHIRSFGGKGTAAGQFAYPYGICMTKHNTVLVADGGNRRIQEVTLEGTHVKFIGQDIIRSEVWGIAIHDDVIALGKYGTRSSNGIMLFSYISGELLSQFGGYGEYMHVTGVTFTADGKHLLIGGYYDRRVSLTTVEGVFVRSYVVGPGLKTALFNREGDIVSVDFENDRVNVFSLVDGTLLRCWGTRGIGEGQFDRPAALAISHNRLYVLDQDSARVQVFE
jgi:DNA-binding beta-propeller fold protein YncE